MRKPAATDDGAPLDEVTPDELLTAVVPITRKGYAPDVIDPLLERAAATIERLAVLDNPALERERRHRADLLQRTLMLAQARADETITEAQAIADEIRGDAEASAQQLIADAEQLAAHLVETERLRAHAILEEALAKRGVLQGDVAALGEFASQARARLRAALEAELVGLDGLLTAVTSGPDLHELDLTDATLDSEPGVAWSDKDDNTAPFDLSTAMDRAPEVADRPVIGLAVREGASQR
ncbi:MAG TPA: hypothetical protein VLV81_10160 [Acidimicrobiia bacterium]|nr:hypothetical protein [Acidimicrobiia bacterium]